MYSEYCRIIAVCCLLHYADELSVHHSNGLWEETVRVFGWFEVKCPVVSTGSGSGTLWIQEGFYSRHSTVESGQGGSSKGKRTHPWRPPVLIFRVLGVIVGS